MSSGRPSPGVTDIEEVPQPGGASAAPSVQQVTQSLARGVAVYAAANFAIRAVNFLLLPVYTRFLTPADYGTISLAETSALIVALFCGLGLEGGLPRLYYQYVDQPDELRGFLGSVFQFGLLNSLAVALLCMVAGPAVIRAVAPGFEVPFFPFIAIAIASAACIQLFNLRLSLYQAEKRPRPYAWLAGGSFVVTATASLILVAGRHAGALGMLTGKLLAAVLSVGVAFSLARRWLAGRFSWRYVRETLALSLPLLPHQLMALGLVAADRFILERYRNLTEVGLYSLAYTFGMVMSVVTTSLMQAWSPMYFDLSRNEETGRPLIGQIGSGIAMLLCAMALFGSAIARDFVGTFLDARYAPVAPVIPWIIAGYLAHAMFALLHLALFQAKRTALLWQVSLVAFAANIALNFALVPRWGMYGAAWATVAAYALEALVMYFYVQRVFPVPYHVAKVLLALAVFTVTLAATQHDWGPHHWAVMATLVPSSFVFLGFISRDELRAALSGIRRNQAR